MTQRFSLMRLALLATSALTVAACGSATAARWNGRGNDAFDKQEYATAQIAYEQALAAQPARAQTLYNLGNTQFRQQAQADAQTTLAEAALAAAPQDDQLAAEAFYNLGNARFAAADYAGAVDAYKESLRRTPDDMDAKVNLELALRKMQENEPTPTPEQTAAPSPTPEASPTDEPTTEPSPTPTPESNAGSPTPEASPSPEASPTASETPTPEATATAEGAPTGEPSPAAQGTPTAMPAEPTPDPATLPPGQMTDAQARQLLEAATSNTQTLQERLQQTLRPLDPSVEKDW